MMMHMLAAILLASVHLVQGCRTKHSELVGATAQFTTKSHGVSGTATVIDDCHFRVEGFSFDGQGPAVYWRGAASTSVLAAGHRLSGQTLSGTVHSSASFEVGLDQGKTFNDVKAISVWCELFSVDFGSLMFTKPAVCRTQRSELIGATAQFTTKSHGVSGTATVIDDCHFKVEGFSFDGQGPAVYWRGAASTSVLGASGHRLSGQTLSGMVHTKANFEVELDQGKTFNDVKAISVWCEQFSADFGSLMFTKSAACRTKHSDLIGATAQFTTKSHGVSGTATVIDDCHFKVEGFSFDGQGPAVYWRGASSTSVLGASGHRLSGQTLSGMVHTNANFEVELDQGKSFKEVQAISVWCEQANADFGSLMFTKPAICRSQRSKLIGATAQFTTKSHGVSGTATVIDDCHFRVNGFSFDGQGPAVYWRGAASTSVLATGHRLSGQTLSGMMHSNANFLVAMDQGKTFNDVQAISVWCEQANADFGSLLFSEPTTVTTTPAPPLMNCMTLIAKKMNLHWMLVGDTVKFMLEGAIGGNMANNWMAFGTTDTAGSMVKGDVTFVGYKDGAPFAKDGYLESRQQCTSDKKGACVDTSNDAQLVEGSVTSGVTKITWTRRLHTGDSSMDHSINASVNMNVIAAYGPYGKKDGEILILKHSTPDATWVGNWMAGAQSSTCTPVEADGSMTPAPNMKNEIETIEDVTMFEVEVQTSTNYPNPPGWGISYFLNQKESPVIKLKRGVEVTFKIKAGETHPFYITDSMIGGNEQGKKTFAGGSFSHGTMAAPYELKWTPSTNASEVPDLVYYQCFVHAKLGWKIMLTDADGVGGLDDGAPKHAMSFLVLLIFTMTALF